MPSVSLSRYAASGVSFGTSGVRARVVDLTDEVCFAYTAAFLQHLRACGAKPARIALAHDLRPSSPRMAAACAAAVEAAGAAVTYCGAIPTPALAHFAIQAGIPAVVVTGSHIPFDRNGLKFYLPTGEILKADEAAIAGATVDLPDGRFTGGVLVGGPDLPAADPAAYALYVRRYLDFFPQGFLAGRRVGVYQHSGVGRDLLLEVLAGLGAEVVPLGRTDTFVPVDTEAIDEATEQLAREWSRAHRLSALVSTDGDADRPLVGDETGALFRGDIVGPLCAAWLGVETVVTPVSSNTVVERCGRFRRVVRTRIGSPFVLEAMAAAAGEGGGPVAGYEANGGFLVGTDLVRHGRRLAALPTRDALLPALSLLALAAERRAPLSSLRADLPPRHTASGRIQGIATLASQRLLAGLAAPEALQAFFGELGQVKAVDRTDGLRVTLDSGEIVHLRPSGNAPELRCYAEADSPARAAELGRWGLAAAGRAVGVAG